MAITYEEIEIANKSIVPTPIKGKNYAEVNQRIKAFRKVYPEGSICTEIISNENGVIVIKAIVYNAENRVIGTGTASEKEGASNINKTSHIENCETSAVGRALGMCGFGIDCAVASKEEVENKEAIAKRIEEEMIKLSTNYTKLRTTLSGLNCDFRDIATDAYILKKANVTTQNLEELDNESLRRLNNTYRNMIVAKTDELIKKNNDKIVKESGEMGDFSG